jgi:hypothetical protein
MMNLRRKLNQFERALVVAVLGAFLLSLLSVSAAPPRPIYPNPPHLATDVAADANLFWSPGNQELIVNGDFETGNLNGWTRINVNGDTFVNNGSYDPNSPDGPLPPLSGNFSTINEQTGPGSQTLYQDITIPAEATSAILSWSDRIRNHNGAFANTPPLQQFKVEVRNTNNVPLALIFLTEPGDEAIANVAKRSADITGFRGQRIRIAFSSDQNLFFFNVHLDNISVIVKSPDTTYDVYFGTNSTLGTNQLLGATANTMWELPPLQPLTTYFWRLVARQGAEQTTGTVWQFTTPLVGPLHHFAWSTLSSPQYTGSPFAATVTARDAKNYLVTNFNGAATLSAAAEPSNLGSPDSTLLPDAFHAAYASYDRATVGYAFMPDTDILVTAFRHYSGEKVSLWTDEGVLLAQQATLRDELHEPPGSWLETSLPAPVPLYANREYRLGVYSGALTTNFARFDFSAGFANGTIHQSYDGFGDNFPTNIHPARWWFVDLVYSAASYEPLPLTPTSANFINGSWTGNLAINAAGSNILLRAEGASGTAGLATPLSVLSADTVRITDTLLTITNVLITFSTVPGRTYQLERTDNLSASWTVVSPGLLADTSFMQVADTTSGRDKQFYRVRVLP